MSKYPNLTDSDSIIMEILWRDGATTSSAIRKEVKSILNWNISFAALKSNLANALQWMLFYNM